MTNEKEWWEERTRKLFHGVWGASPWNEERMTDAAIDVLRDIVAEAERRGEMKAWEEISDLSLSLVDDDVKLGVKAGERFAVGVQSVANELYDFSKRKLTSLKTP